MPRKTTPKPVPLGRPKKPAEKVLRGYSVRLTEGDIDKLLKLGGGKWVRARIAAAKVREGA